MLKNIFFILLIQTINSLTFKESYNNKCDYIENLNNNSRNNVLNILTNYPIIIIKNNTDFLNIFDNFTDILKKEVIFNKCLEISNQIINFTENKESFYKIENITIDKNNDINQNNKVLQIDDNEKLCKIPIFMSENIILQNIKDKGFGFFENLKFSSKNLYSFIYKVSNDDENINKNKYLRSRNEPKTIIKYN